MFRVVAGAVLALASLIACASQPSTGPVTLRVAAASNVALAVPLIGLDDDPQLSDQVESVEIVPVTSPDEIRSMLTSGQADVATMPMTTAAALANGGVDVQLLGAVDAALLKVVGPGNDGWESLRGQTVHLPFRGDFADLLFNDLAAENDLVPGEDFDVAYAGTLPELVTVMSTGRAEFAVLPEHFATMARQAAGAAGHPVDEPLDLTEEWTRVTGAETLPASALVIRTEVAQEHPDLVSSLRRHLADAASSAADDYDAAAAAINAQTQIPIELAADVLPRLQVRFLTPDDARSDIDSLLTRMTEIESRSTGGGLPDQAFYD